MGEVFRRAVDARRRVPDGTSTTPTTPTGTAVAERSPDPAPPNPVDDIIARIRKMEPEYQRANADLDAGQLVRDAVTAVRRDRRIARCQRSTVLGAIMTVAQLNLRLVDTLGHAWIRPVYDPDAQVWRATVIIGYQGYKELAYRSGMVADIMARTVYPGDHFDVAYGLDERLEHVPAFDEAEPGDATYYYVVVHLTTGGRVWHVMSRGQVERHRDRNALARDASTGELVGPWRDHPEPMAHKTVYRLMARWLPMGSAMALAVAADQTVRDDVNPLDMEAAAGDRLPHGAAAYDDRVVDSPADDSAPGARAADVAPDGAIPDPRTPGDADVPVTPVAGRDGTTVAAASGSSPGDDPDVIDG